MKKFTFSLERMLDYEESLKEKEKNALMQMYAERNEVEEQITRCEMQFAQTNQQLLKKTMEGTTVLELQLVNLNLQSLRIRQKQLAEDLEQMELQIAKQLEVLLHHSKQVTSLDKLKDKQFDEYSYLLRKSEEDEISEMVSSRFVRENPS